jgi:hypothetical protein
MGKIDRRGLIGAAGATVALAACSKGAEKSGSAADIQDLCDFFDSEKTGLSVQGTGPEYEVPGIPDDNIVNGKNRRYPKHTTNKLFTEDHLCLVYLKLENNRLTSSHAHFAKALSSVAGKFRNFSATRSWVKNGEQATDAPIGGERKNFQPFTFGSPTKIYFFLDNAGDARFDPDNLIQMTQYGRKGKKDPKDPNNSFFNPEILNVDGLELLVLENWYTNNKNGKLITKYKAGQTTPVSDAEFFSMNIHFLLKSGGGAPAVEIPMVIDPDGGNMGSQP